MTRSAIRSTLLVLFMLLLAVGARVFLGRVRDAWEAASESTCTSCFHRLSMQWVGFYSEYETFPPGHGLGSRHTGDWEEWLDDHSQAPGPGHIHEDRYSDKAVHHALVIGPGTVGEGQRDLTIPDIADGWTNTLAFVEIRGQVPREARYATLHIDDLASLLDESGALPPYDIHDLGRGLMFMDGAMYRQKKPLNRQQLLALMTIAGGENLTRESLEKSGAIELRNAGYLPVLRPNVGFPIRGFTP